MRAVVGVADGVSLVVCLVVGITLACNRGFQRLPNALFVVLMYSVCFLALATSLYVFVLFDRSAMVVDGDETSPNFFCKTQAFLVSFAVPAASIVHLSTVCHVRRIVDKRSKPDHRAPIRYMTVGAFLCFGWAWFAVLVGDVRPLAVYCAPIGPHMFVQVQGIVAVTMAIVAVVVSTRLACHLYYTSKLVSPKSYPSVESQPYSKQPHSNQSYKFHPRLHGDPRARVLPPIVRNFRFAVASSLLWTVALVGGVVSLASGERSVNTDLGARDSVSVAEVVIGLAGLVFSALYVLLFHKELFRRCMKERVWVARAVDFDPHRFKNNMELVGYVTVVSRQGPLPRLSSGFWKHSQPVGSGNHHKRHALWRRLGYTGTASPGASSALGGHHMPTSVMTDRSREVIVLDTSATGHHFASPQQRVASRHRHPLNMASPTPKAVTMRRQGSTGVHRPRMSPTLTPSRLQGRSVSARLVVASAESKPGATVAALPILPARTPVRTAPPLQASELGDPERRVGDMFAGAPPPARSRPSSLATSALPTDASDVHGAGVGASATNSPKSRVGGEDVDSSLDLPGAVSPHSSRLPSPIARPTRVGERGRPRANVRHFRSANSPPHFSTGQPPAVAPQRRFQHGPPRGRGLSGSLASFESTETAGQVAFYLPPGTTPGSPGERFVRQMSVSTAGHLRSVDVALESPLTPTQQRSLRSIPQSSALDEPHK